MNHETPSHPPRGRVILLSSDTRMVAGLDPALAGADLRLEVVHAPAELRHLLESSDPTGRVDSRPRLVLVDLRSWSTEDGPLLVSDGGRDAQALPLPLVCLGSPDDLPQRLAATRAGVLAWFPLNLAPADLAARVLALAADPDAGPERVLVVDDQPVAALFAARVLEQAGMVTERVAEPLAVLTALDRFAPDLILMDLHMPGASGVELTGVIREQDRFADLPIVFLSGELDPERQLEALRIGGDDFLAKPVAPDRLVACVRQRLARARQRARLRGAAAAPGPAGGLVDRERLLARLDRLLHDQSGGPWALAYLELPGDEAALTRLAGAASARAGSQSLMARVGGQGVAVLLRGQTPDTFAAMIDVLAQDLRAAMRPPDGHAAPAPNFGIGWCAVVDGGGESVTLVSRARKAAGASLHGGQCRAERYLGAGAAPESAAGAESLFAGIAAGNFLLLFQPMVPLRGPASERYEATLRLRVADGELLGPSGFAPAALRAGQAAGIDRWLLAAGLDALRRRREAGRPVELFLHQSFVSAADEAWVMGVRDAISARNLIDCRPVVQFQLADADRHLDLASVRTEQLSRLGIRLCINGLTPGDRAERVLKRLPVAFVRLAPGLSGEQRKTLVDLAHGRQARVIATGVEGPEAITVLYGAGVDLIQGPYVQPPAETMEFDFADELGDGVPTNSNGL